MNTKITSKLIIRTLALGASCLIFWAWYQGRRPDQQAGSNPPISLLKEQKDIFPPLDAPKNTTKPKVRHVVVQPAGAVKVPKVSAEAPDAVKNFRNWAQSYFDAAPEARAKLIQKGQELAELQRAAIKQTIVSDPRLALQLAVPMVVRQDLPDEIEKSLERRVNEVGELMVLASLHAEDTRPEERMPAVQRKFKPAAGSGTQTLTAYVYGERSKMLSRNSARVSGVEVDGQLAVLDSPIRQLEIGERPDPDKPTVNICPISGKTTPIEKTNAAVPAPVTAKMAVVEDNRKVYVLCASGHIIQFGDQLIQEETDAHWRGLTLAEGGTGGGTKPFDVPATFTTGTKSLLYLRVAFPDVLVDPQSETKVYDNLRQATDFFMSNSFGRFYLTPTVTPLIVLPYPEVWYSSYNDGYFLVRDHALELATRLGYDTAKYDLDVVEYKGGPGSFGGLGYVGGKGVWLKSSEAYVLTHELGHNLGLYHSNYWDTNPPSVTGPGNNREYANKYDVMGESRQRMGDIVAVHKAKLNWLPPENVHRAAESGRFRIYQVDQDRADADKRYALSVNMDSERDFWFEFRQKETNNVSLSNGLMVTWNPWGSGSHPDNDMAFGSNGGAHLLDMTPGSRPWIYGTPTAASNVDSRDDAALVLGQTYSDESIDLHVTPVLKSTTVPPYMDVVVNRGPFPDNTAPRLTLAASAAEIDVSETVTLTATGTDLENDALAYAWHFDDGTYSINNSRIQKKKWLRTGTYSVVCILSDMKGKTETKSITVNVIGADPSGESPQNYISISGTVKDVSGNPVEGALISTDILDRGATQSGQELFRSTYSDSKGRYLLTNIRGLSDNNQNPPQLTLAVTKYPNIFFSNQSALFTPGRVSLTDFNWEDNGIPPTVNVTVTVNTPSVTEGQPGTITLTRGTNRGILNVQMLVGSQGSAVRGTSATGDYSLPHLTLANGYYPSQVATTTSDRSQQQNALGITIPDFTTSVTIQVPTRSDGLAEGTEYAVIDFPDTAFEYQAANQPRRYPYHVTGARKAVIAIQDTDSPLPVVTLIRDAPNMSENGTSGLLRVRRDGNSLDWDLPLTVDLTYSGASTRGTDFTAPTSVTIVSGQSEAFVNLSTIDDFFAEGTESFTVSLASSASYLRHTRSIPDKSLYEAEIFIADNDQPVVQVTATVPSTAEGSSSAGKFVIRRAGIDIGEDLVVNFALGGSALSGSDYRRVDGTAVIPANELTVDVDIKSLQDTIDEPNQTVRLVLAADPEYAIGVANEATVTIVDNDPSQFTIQTTRSQLLESNTGKSDYDAFTISRPTAGGAATVKFQVTGNAIQRDPAKPELGGDFLLVPLPLPNGPITDRITSVSFAANEVSKSIRVQVFADEAVERPESVSITLLTGTGYTLGFEKQSTTWIRDRDSIEVDVSYDDTHPFDINDPSGPLDSVVEGSADPFDVVKFSFHRNGNLATPLKIKYAFGGTASLGTDFEYVGTPPTVAGEINLIAGRGREFITLRILNDTILEGTEKLTVTILSDANYEIRTASSSVSIDDNETYGNKSIGFSSPTATVLEKILNSDGNYIGSSYTSTVTRSGPTTGEATVFYRLAGGSATGRGVDYNFVIPPAQSSVPEQFPFTTGFLIFAIGETTKSVTLTTVADDVPEGDETIELELFGAVGADISTANQVITLQDKALPEVFTDALPAAAGDTAVLRGRVMANNLTTTAFFEWGTTTSSLTKTPNIAPDINGTSFTAIASTIPNLVYPRTYYYRAVASNLAGITRGILRTLRTIKAPEVVTLLDAGHTANSVTFAGTINPNRGAVDYYFAWGTTRSSLSNLTTKRTLPNATKPILVTEPVTGLPEGTVVYYQLVAISLAGIPAKMLPETGAVPQKGTIQAGYAVPFQTVGNLVVNAAANHSSAGTSNWRNLGTASGDFVALGLNAIVPNVHDTGVPGVFFDGKTSAYAIPMTPPVQPAPPEDPVPDTWSEIIGARSRSIEVWAYNPGYGTPDALVNMGKDGVATQVAINHSNLAQPTSALRHGNAAGTNASYTAKNLPALGQWNHFAYVYEGPKKTATLYVNGVKNTTIKGLTLATGIEDVTIGALRDAAGTTLSNYLQGYINSVRIHGGVLTPANVLANFRIGPARSTVTAPYAATTGVSGLTLNSATLNGLVNTPAAPATAWIEWGTSAVYDNASLPVPVAISANTVPIALPISNLVPGVEYHYRVAARNLNGTSYGDDVTFVPRLVTSSGTLWVDLRAQDFTTGDSTWVNRGSLGDFTAFGTVNAVPNVATTGFPGVQLDGSTNAFESMTKASIDFSYGNDQTLEVWALNPVITADETLVNQGRAITPASRLRLSYGPTFGVDDNAAVPAPADGWTTPPTANTWTHFALVVSAGTRTLYINGVPSGTTTQPAGVNQWDDNVLLGAKRNDLGVIDFSSDVFSGFINSVKIHGGAMLPAQITASFNAGPVPKTAAPVVVTTGTNSVGDVYANLVGTIQAGELPTTYKFEWGTTALTNSTPITSVLNTFALNTVSVPISGLAPLTTYQYRLVADNSRGTVNGATLTFTTTAVVNDPPVATNATFSGNEGTPISGTATGTDEESDAITAVLVTQAPQSGTLSVIGANGNFTYTPDVGFYGVDRFEFRVVAGGQTSAPGVITLNVTVPAPTALTTNLFTKVSENMDGQVLAKGPIAATNGYTKLTDPNVLHGAITTFNSDTGEFIFEPVTGFVGTANFTFRVTDGSAPSAPATVTIVIGGPEAGSKEFSGFEDDVIADALPTTTDPSPGTLSFSVVATANAKHGVVKINDNGTFTYNPKAGFVGVDRFQFQATNGTTTLVSNPGTVTIIITKRPPNWVWTQGSNLPKSFGVYGRLGVPSAANLPGARGNSVSWAEPDGTLWIFGGQGFAEGKAAGLLNDLWKRDAVTGVWTWVSGSKTINAKGNYGAQGITESTNQPGARSGAASWMDQDGTLWMFGGNGFDATSLKAGALNDLWSFDPTTSEWTWWKGSSLANVNGTYGVRSVTASSNTPGSRQGSTTWLDGENNLWLFGGLGLPGAGQIAGQLGDLWKYSPESNVWTWVSGSNGLNTNGVYGILDGNSSLTFPGSRSYAAGWIAPDGIIYLFGGSGLGATGKSVGFLNDVWAYYPESNRWSWIKGSTLSGVATVSNLLGVPNPLNNPSGRAGAVAWTTGKEEAWLFGGQARSGNANDLWRFDLLTKTWTMLKGLASTGVYGSLGVGLPGNTPGPRRDSIVQPDLSGDLWLFSGANGSNSFNDLWKLDSVDSPRVQTLAAEDETANGAKLWARIQPDKVDTLVGFRYWPLGRLEDAETEDLYFLSGGSGVQMVDLTITGLTAGSRYAFQAFAESNGLKTYGEILTFQTTGAAPAITVSFATATASVSENAGTFSIEVQLSAPASQLVTIPIIATPKNEQFPKGFPDPLIDYASISNVITFSPGQTIVAYTIPLINDLVTEETENLELTLGTPTSGITLGAPTVFNLDILDDDDSPRITQEPLSQFVSAGQSVTLTVTATGPRLKYQWMMDSKIIPKATANTYQFVATLKSAAIYTCSVSNEISEISTERAEIFVLDSKKQFRLIEKGSVVMQVTAAAPKGSRLTYVWRDKNDPDPNSRLQDGGFIRNTGTNAMTITNVIPTDSKVYVCRVEKTGNSSFFKVSEEQALSVPNVTPVVETQPTGITGIVGVPFSYQVVVNTSAPNDSYSVLRRTPSKFTATGLPRGLSINAATGLISGRPTLITSAPVRVTITASNGTYARDGLGVITGPRLVQNSDPTDMFIQIVSLPTTVTGNFVGLLDRQPATSGMGGRLDLSITTAGAYTLKLTLSGYTASAKGTVTPTIAAAAVTEVKGSTLFKRKVGQSNLGVDFTVTNTGAMTAVLTDLQTPPITAAGTGVRQGYAVTLAAPNQGNYTMLFELQEPQVGVLSVPQGNGFMTMSLAKDGRITGAGRTADGNAFSLATVLGTDGKMPVFASFTPILGSLHGIPVIDTTTSYLSGTVSWNKSAAPRPVKTLLYHDGFAPINMDVLGGRYLPVENGAVVRGLVNNANKAINARLEFSEGGLLTSELDNLVFSITNPTPLKATQVIGLPLNNPNKLTFSLPAKPAGSFNGKVVILNSNPTLVRNLVFQGVIAKINATDWLSAGFVLVPQLPQPGQTIKTSPVLSGQVVLEPNP